MHCLQTWSLTCLSCASMSADSCAGITGGCLQDDLRLTKGGSSCTPILDGASCGAGKTCQAGYCGGECLGVVGDSVSCPDAMPHADEPYVPVAYLQLAICAVHISCTVSIACAGFGVDGCMSSYAPAAESLERSC
jgi:hypothetical protein